MHEQQQIDARTPGQGRERDLTAPRDRLEQDLKERFPGKTSAAIERDRAPPLVQDRAQGQRRTALGEATVVRRAPLPKGGRRRFEFSRRRGDLVDHGPMLTVLGAEAVGGAMPLGGPECAGGQRESERTLQVYGEGRPLWRDRQQAIGMLGFGPTLAVDSEQTRELSFDDALAESRLPAEPRGGDGDGADGVADVVVTVAERPLAVLPGLAPVDRGEA